MASKIATMNPKNQSDLEEYAIALGLQAKKYRENVAYKDFVFDLIKDLTTDFSQTQLTELSSFVQRLATTRAKEGKNVQHFLPEETEEEDESDDGNFADYVDFM